ncbi:MAG: hypothetical protein M3O32_00110 [Actinomycetota bacterium]|nr:hypothetical protein [Actinomycetota bacterium]
MAIAAAKRPRATLVAATCVIAFLPIYWTPQLPGLPTTSAVLICLPLAVIALGLPGKAPLSSVDALVFALLMWQLFTFQQNFHALRHQTLPALISAAAPFLMMRGMARTAALRRAFLSAVVGCGVALSVLAIQERQTGVNFFQTIKSNGYLSTVWAIPYTRNGVPRAAGSFGQPLLLSLFLAAGALIIVMRVVDAKRLRVREGLGLLALLSGISATGGRLALGVIALGSALYVMRRPAHYVAGAIAGAALVSFASPLLLSFVSGEDAASQDSASYRGKLFSALSDPHNFSVQGLLRTDPFNASGFIRDFNGSVDNEFLLRLLQSGLPELLLMLALLVVVTRDMLLGLPGPDRQLGVLSVVAFLSLLFVALLLQQGTFFWMFLGGLAGANRAPGRLSPVEGEPHKQKELVSV